MSVFQSRLLEGKVAFVTGGSSGINQRIAERFAEHGAKVMIFARKPDKLEAAVAAMQAAGGTAAGYSGDVREYSAVHAGLEKTHDAFGPIDILLCGAAGNFPAPVLGMSANGFKAVIDIDLLGTFNTCRAAYEFLRRPGASVIAISANHAHQPYYAQAHVCAGKAGVDILMKCLALEWGPAGVRANCITPGPIDDTEGMRRLAPTEEARQAAICSVPLRRFGTRDEIADLALFLCSPAAQYISGAIIPCDGAQGLTGPRIANGSNALA